MATDVFRRIVVPIDFSGCAEGPGVSLSATASKVFVGRVLLGSVADRVIRTAPCPVLTVRKPE